MSDWATLHTPPLDKRALIDQTKKSVNGMSDQLGHTTHSLRLLSDP